MKSVYSCFVLLMVCLFAENAEAQVNVNFKSSDLPLVLIDTHGSGIYDDFEIIADMGIVDNLSGTRNDTLDAFNNYNGKISIEIRGSSSQMFPKKQYKIELKTADGEDQKASLMGMPAEEDWVLFAPYNDRSLMRDVLAYKFGRDLNRYAPRTRYCEVVMKQKINGKTSYRYQGVYVMIEKIKRDKNRVDIAKLEPNEISGDDLTGGYIIKIDKTTGDSGPGFHSAYRSPNTNSYTSFQYEYPKWNEIASEQETYIKNFVGKFEAALNGNNFKDPVNGYAKYIDVDSFVDFLIMQEITRNVDGYRLSTFFHKQKDSDGGKIVMGPIWDFNLGFGNADYCAGARTSGWAYDFNYECPGDGAFIPFWWNRLLQDPAFNQKLAVRWEGLRAGKFSRTSINKSIDSIYTILNAEAQQRNFMAWPTFGQYIWPNAFIGSSYIAEIQYLKNWIDDRMTWLNNNMPNVVTDNEPVVTGINFSLSPNPVTDHIEFNYNLTIPGHIELDLMDITGRVVKRFEETHTRAGEYTEVLLTKDLSPGMHLVRMTFNGRTVTSKLVKNN